MPDSPEPDAFLAACPSRALLSRLGEKWSMLIVVALEDGEVRFGALRRRLEGVSQKMLTQNLRSLERDGLVVRRLHDERPLRVGYALTPAGRSLLPHVHALKRWAEAHLAPVERSNADFDAEKAGARVPVE